jgi:hypothetical protein
MDPLMSLRQRYRDYFEKEQAHNTPEDVLDEALAEVEDPE